MANVTIVNQPSQVQTVSGTGQQGSPDAGKANTYAQGSVVSGTIIGKDAGGNYVLRTASDGNIALRSATPLTYNSDVEIRIGASGTGSTTARILTVNGQPFDSNTPLIDEDSDTVSNSLLAQASQSTPAGAAQEQVTVPVRAVVVPAPPAPAPAPAAGNTNPNTNSAAQNSPLNTSNLNTGDNVVLHVQAQQSPAATAQQTQTAPAPATTSQQAVVAPPAGSAPQAPATTAQQGITVPQTAVSTSGTELSGAQVVPQVNDAAAATAQQASTQASAALTEQAAPAAAQAAATPGNTPTQTQSAALAQYAAYAKQSGTATGAPAPAQPAAAASSSTAPQTQLVQGQVASNNADGTVTILTPTGPVTVQPEALPQGTSLAPGTQVQIELTSSASQPVANPIPVSTTPAPLSEIALSWATLKDIITVTGDSTNSDPASVNTPASAQASPVLANLPQLGASFAASSMAFISAVAEGNLRKLLGDDTIEALKQSGRTDLLEKFSAELDSISQSMTQAAARPMPGWQMIFMPFVYQESLQQARIYVKRDPPKKDKASEQSGGDTRFIVEVDLSEIGPLQMDGLVRKQQQSTAFDLVIRSRSGFSQQDKTEISAIYADAAAMTGFKGSLAFQVTHDFPVKPLDDAPSAGTRSITV
jgi:hypothetical protein